MPPDSPIKRVARVVVGAAVIFAVLGAFLARVASGEGVEPWLVFLVSVLGLAAAVAIFGTDAVRTAYAVVQREHREPRERRRR